jgi:cobalt-zinc-cadmium efflux system membrane fusion protein
MTAMWQLATDDVHWVNVVGMRWRGKAEVQKAHQFYQDLLFKDRSCIESIEPLPGGAFVNDPTAPMMTIANLDTVWVTANVPEKDTSFVSKDQPVSVTFPAYPGKVYEGKVLFVSDVLEPDTRRTKVRIAFDNPDRSLKPGMFANVSFSAPMISRLVVPTSALLMSNDRTSVFAEVEPWTFVRRDVVTEYEEGNAAVILSGLNPGERVIVKGAVVFND